MKKKSKKAIPKRTSQFRYHKVDVIKNGKEIQLWHPAKQISHTSNTWTNRRYTHNPNNLKNYIKDEELSIPGDEVYYQNQISQTGYSLGDSRIR